MVDILFLVLTWVGCLKTLLMYPFHHFKNRSLNRYLQSTTGVVSVVLPGFSVSNLHRDDRNSDSRETKVYKKESPAGFCPSFT